MISHAFSRFSAFVSHQTGKPYTFALAVFIILAWIFTGPIFDYSDTWQLIINTSTTIITFLQVFVIQNTQNRDSIALQTKLDELIRASAAHNNYIGIESLTEEELQEFRKTCKDRALVDRLQNAHHAGEKAAKAMALKVRQAMDRHAGVKHRNENLR